MVHFLWWVLRCKKIYDIFLVWNLTLQVLVEPEVLQQEAGLLPDLPDGGGHLLLALLQCSPGRGPPVGRDTGLQQQPLSWARVVWNSTGFLWSLRSSYEGELPYIWSKKYYEKPWKAQKLNEPFPYPLPHWIQGLVLCVCLYPAVVLIVKCHNLHIKRSYGKFI